MTGDDFQMLDGEAQARSSDYDLIFEVLANERRRRVLHHLVDEPVWEIDALVDRLAEEESSSREDVACSLHHVHLPKLEDAGIVDSENGAIQYLGGSLIEQHLRSTREADLPTP